MTETTRRKSHGSVGCAELQSVDAALGAISVRPLLIDLTSTKPKTRAGCRDVARPCPFVSCRWNTYLDVDASGGVTFNWGERDPSEMDPQLSCALDVADDGGASDESMQRIYGLSAKALHTLTEDAMKKLRHYSVSDDLKVFKMS